MSFYWSVWHREGGLGPAPSLPRDSRVCGCESKADHRRLAQQHTGYSLKGSGITPSSSSVTPYAARYTRLAPSLLTSPEEVNTTLCTVENLKAEVGRDKARGALAGSRCIHSGTGGPKERRRISLRQDVRRQESQSLPFLYRKLINCLGLRRHPRLSSPEKSNESEELRICRRANAGTSTARRN